MVGENFATVDFEELERRMLLATPQERRLDKVREELARRALIIARTQGEITPICENYLHPTHGRLAVRGERREVVNKNLRIMYTQCSTRGPQRKIGRCAEQYLYLQEQIQVFYKELEVLNAAAFTVDEPSVAFVHASEASEQPWRRELRQLYKKVS